MNERENVFPPSAYNRRGIPRHALPVDVDEARVRDAPLQISAAYVRAIEGITGTMKRDAAVNWCTRCYTDHV